MPKRTVSVVVPVLDPGKDLKPLIRSLDEQDLPYDRYRVVFVDLGSTDGTLDRLRDLVDYRPQVTVLTEIDRASAWRTALEDADTDFALLLDADDRLHPWALPRLLDHAEEGGFDVVLGRNSGLGPIGFVPESLDQPWQPDAQDAAVALLAPTALIRTVFELLAESDSSTPAAELQPKITERIAHDLGPAFSPSYPPAPEPRCRAQAPC